MIDMKIMYIILVTLAYLYLMFRSARDNSPGYGSGYGSGVGLLLEWFLWTLLYLVFWIIWLIVYL